MELEVAHGIAPTQAAQMIAAALRGGVAPRRLASVEAELVREATSS